MTRHARSFRWCGAAAGDFPVVATVLAVAGCFGEALLQKYFSPGRGLQIALALLQTIPVGLLLRYVVIRSRKGARDQVR